MQGSISSNFTCWGRAMMPCLLDCNAISKSVNLGKRDALPFHQGERHRICPCTTQYMRPPRISFAYELARQCLQPAAHVRICPWHALLYCYTGVQACIHSRETYQQYRYCAGRISTSSALRATSAPKFPGLHAMDITPSNNGFTLHCTLQCSSLQ